MSLEVRFKKSLDGFTLDVEFEIENDIVGLLGASGCGKSLTLKCIAGILRPDRGRIVLDGTVLFDSEKGISLSPQKRRAGLLFQNCALFPNMTVEQNIMAVLSLSPQKHRSQRFASLIRRFRLNGLENHYPAQLSGGQQQRTALARIMAGEPKILMLDEPLSALDSYLRWQLEGELMQTLEEFGGPAIYVSHNRDEVYRLCGKACVMDRGHNETVRTVKELFESPDTLASSLLTGCKNYSAIERIDGCTLRAVDWNAELQSSRPVADDVRYIGVHAHRVAISPEVTGENILPCRILRIIDDAGSTIVSLRPANATSENDFSRIRMELPEEAAKALHPGDILHIKIFPRDIMLLRK